MKIKKRWNKTKYKIITKKYTVKNKKKNNYNHKTIASFKKTN